MGLLPEATESPRAALPEAQAPAKMDEALAELKAKVAAVEVEEEK